MDKLMLEQDIEKIATVMISYYGGDPKRIQHFIKVHSFAKLIGLGEQLELEQQYTLEIAALIHDIGIKIAEQKFGKCDGKLQEQEGEPVARELLTALEIKPEVLERVCYLVAHHHTYTNIDGIDYQILLEADFLVNMFEDEFSEEAAKAALEKIFKTQTGSRICRQMFWCES